MSITFQIEIMIEDFEGLVIPKLKSTVQDDHSQPTFLEYRMFFNFNLEAMF